MKKMITRRNFLRPLAFPPLLWVWLPAAVLPAPQLPARLLPLLHLPLPLRT